MRLGNPRGKLLLSEKLFLVLIGGSLVGVGATLTYVHLVHGPLASYPILRRVSTAAISEAVRQVSEETRQVPWVVREHRSNGQPAREDLTSKTPDAHVRTPVAPLPVVPTPAAAASAERSSASNTPEVLSETSSSTSSLAPSSAKAPPPLRDARSVFVPSRVGLRLVGRSADAWSQWPDTNARRITGPEGRAQLAEAFELVARSLATGIVADLERKGIPVSFGTAAAFNGDQAGMVATLSYATAKPPVMGTVPEIVFNPLFLRERPEVLAAALVQEGTRFQQLLEGTLNDPARDTTDLEFVARWNAAAFWEEVRGRCWPFHGAPAQELEFDYRSGLRGEAALRDTLAALHR